RLENELEDITQLSPVYHRQPHRDARQAGYRAGVEIADERPAVGDDLAEADLVELRIGRQLRAVGEAEVDELLTGKVEQQDIPPVLLGDQHALRLIVERLQIARLEARGRRQGAQRANVAQHLRIHHAQQPLVTLLHRLTKSLPLLLHQKVAQHQR